MGIKLKQLLYHQDHPRDFGAFSDIGPEEEQTSPKGSQKYAIETKLIIVGLSENINIIDPQILSCGKQYAFERSIISLIEPIPFEERYHILCKHLLSIPEQGYNRDKDRQQGETNSAKKEEEEEEE